MKLNSLTHFSLALLAAVLLQACGGGSSSETLSDNGSNNLPVLEQGQQATDSDGDGVPDINDAEPNNINVAGTLTIRRDIGGVTGAGGTEFRRYNTVGFPYRSYTDDDSDGNWENEYSYNGYRQVSQRLTDTDDDGDFDQTYTNTYNGSLVSQRYAQGNTANYTHDYIYSESGVLTQINKDTDNDGNLDLRDIFTYVEGTYNAPDLVELDVDNLDAASATIDYIYTDDVLTSVNYDTDNDTVIDESVSYTYHENGQVETVSYEDTGDSNPERIFNYSDDGVLQTAIEDDDSDGTADLTETYFYDGNRVIRIEGDTDNDTIADQETLFTYTSVGLADTIIETVNGETDVTYTYFYDADGRLTSVTKDVAGSTAEDEAVVITWDGYVGFVFFSFEF